MITGPTLDTREVQDYVAIRTQVTMEEMDTVPPQLHDEVFAWLETQGVPPAGAPFIRYHVINMSAQLDIELGVPVARPLSGDERIRPGVIPAGHYASLVYTGDYAGLIEANRVLIDWAKENGITWDAWEAENGDAFGGRFEFYPNGPDTEPDPAKWETEVAIRLADQPQQ